MVSWFALGDESAKWVICTLIAFIIVCTAFSIFWWQRTKKQDYKKGLRRG